MAKTKQSVADLIDELQFDITSNATDKEIPDVITFVEGEEWLGLPHHPSNPDNFLYRE